MFWSLRYRLFWYLCFSIYSLHFCLSRQSMVLLCARISVRCLDCVIWKTKICWCSIDAHFLVRVTKISCTVMPEKAAMISYMNYCHNTTLRLPRMEDQELLTLHWNPFSGLGRERFTLVFASKGAQYSMYGCLQPDAIYMTRDTKPKIVDIPLTLIFRMGQWPCHFLFCL